MGLLLAVGGCMTMGKPVLSAADLDDAERVTACLNGLPRFEAHFTQSGSFGVGSGLIWLDRPGHLRIDYAGAASRVMVIADGRVRVLDRSSGALTTMAVSRTPLGLLLAPTISLSGAAHIESLVHQRGQIRVVLTRTDAPAQGRLTLEPRRPAAAAGGGFGDGCLRPDFDDAVFRHRPRAGARAFAVRAAGRRPEQLSSAACPVSRGKSELAT